MEQAKTPAPPGRYGLRCFFRALAAENLAALLAAI
jgi:hypothetical protein